MKKKIAAATDAAVAEPETAATMGDCLVKHAAFFDRLVELIPPRYYLATGDDEELPWLPSLSKAQRARIKEQARASYKTARRARLDPTLPSPSTLDLLKSRVAAKSDGVGEESEDDEVEDEEDEDEEEDDEEEEGLKDQDSEREQGKSEDGSDDDDDDDEEEEDDESDGDDERRAKDEEHQKLTYDELRDKLHRKIAELRGNRCTRPSAINKPKKDKAKKSKKKIKKGVGKEEKQKERNHQKENNMRKRRRDGGDGEEGESGHKKQKQMPKKREEDFEFGKVLLDPKDARKKSRKVNKKAALEKARKMKKIVENDPAKAEKVSWKTAVSRAAGEKVHDNPELIKKSIKREMKQKKKNAEKWTERQKTVAKTKMERQQKRTENIMGRIEDKRQRRIEKREKKLMRPGFEGRKEGYINQ